MQHCIAFTIQYYSKNVLYAHEGKFALFEKKSYDQEPRLALWSPMMTTQIRGMPTSSTLSYQAMIRDILSSMKQLGSSLHQPRWIVKIQAVTPWS